LQLAFDVDQLGRCEERGALDRRVGLELVGVGVEQRGHVGFGGGRAPAVRGRIADERCRSRRSSFVVMAPTIETRVM
jgi:hypothetical protein